MKDRTACSIGEIRCLNGSATGEGRVLNEKEIIDKTSAARKLDRGLSRMRSRLVQPKSRGE
jgi:hypothetical protein